MSCLRGHVLPDQTLLQQIAEDLRKGNRVPPVTVRELLSWFSAQRRGYWVVMMIRDTLTAAGLETKPDFESAYIDSEITFALAGAVAAVPQGEATATPQLYADPTYRISKLAAANSPPVCVPPDARLQEAITLMLTYDFSQLPVMTNERDVKGVISWTSIGARLSLGKQGQHVREFMDSHQEIRADASLFQAIPLIVQHQYVLVRGADNRITGIVTASDLSLQFQQLAEPFLLLGEIENHIRWIIDGRFSKEELADARVPGDTDRQVAGVADLTFGEYIRLLENQARWVRLNLPIDRVTFCEQLDRIRLVRNDVMHFDPDGIPQEDLNRLRDFAKFLGKLQSIGVP